MIETPHIEEVIASTEEILAMKFPLKRRYGPWRFKTSNWTLALRHDRYYIDLEECRTSAEVLDWIAQVAGKTWATPQMVGWLVKALDDIFNLQACLCSHGKSKRIDPVSVIQARIKNHGIK